MERMVNWMVLVIWTQVRVGTQITHHFSIICLVIIRMLLGVTWVSMDNNLTLLHQIPCHIHGILVQNLLQALMGWNPMILIPKESWIHTLGKHQVTHWIRSLDNNPHLAFLSRFFSRSISGHLTRYALSYSEFFLSFWLDKFSSCGSWMMGHKGHSFNGLVCPVFFL